MSFREAITLALATLWANRLRSILTVIGNVVAVLSVVMVVAVVQGLDLFVAREVRQTGSDVFAMVKIGLSMDYETYLKALSRPDLKVEDAVALSRQLQLAEVVVPRQDGRATITAGARSAENVPIAGVGDGYPLVSDLPLAAGRHLGEADVEARASVIVIGDGIREKLFAHADPIGGVLRVGRFRYTVVGVLAAKGGRANSSADDQLFIPITTYRKQFGGRGSVDILVKAKANVPLEAAQEEASLFLKIRRGHKPWDKPDFDVYTDEQLYSLYQNATRGIFGLLIGVVSLSLVVGGIVIMNIMLVSVTERTREIGIRKALGARRSDIVRQFLVESVVLASLGGVFGVFLGVVGALLLRALSPLPAAVEPWSIVVGLLLASSVGLFFGIYPAHRASQLTPIAALRAEG